MKLLFQKIIVYVGTAIAVGFYVLWGMLTGYPITQMSVRTNGGAPMFSDVLNMTVAQGIAWLITVGIVGFVAYGSAFLPFSDFWKNVVKVVVSAMLIAGVTALASFIPDSFLQLKLLDAAFAVLTLIVGTVGTIKFASLKAKEHKVALAGWAAQEALGK